MADTLKLDQYDDDLTIGLDDFNDDIYADEDELLRFQPPESPLANLQSIVISIDWEISDEILLQFNEEILALREIWADEKIYLVYLQALEQISKYIYQEKVAVHPSAIKLLPLFFQNLEKISSSELMDDEEKQAILVADVKRFNILKKEINALKSAKSGQPTGDGTNALQNLKALVLGLDWEVTEDDLNQLRREVLYLENLYSTNKPRLILLQGIGTLAAYIRHKGGNADASSFNLLHDFFAALERLATSSLSAGEEKKALFTEVEKFNAFKAKIAGTLSPEAIELDKKERAQEDEPRTASTVIAPAFSDIDPAHSSGFQEDIIAEEVGDSGELANKISTFFPEEEEEKIQLEEKVEDKPEDVIVEAETRLDDFFGDDMTEQEKVSDRELALQGVAVEIEGDDEVVDDEPLLSDEESPAFIAAKVDLEEEQILNVEDETESRLDDFFGGMEEAEPEGIDEALALRGVDVETEADDDSEEIALIKVGEEPAPALVENTDELLEEDIESRLDSLFGDDEDFAFETPETPEVPETPAVTVRADLEISEDLDDDFEELGFIKVEEESTPALATDSDVLLEEDIESRLDALFGDEDDFTLDSSDVSEAPEQSPIADVALSGELDVDDDISLDKIEPSSALEDVADDDIADELGFVFDDDTFTAENESKPLIEAEGHRDQEDERVDDVSSIKSNEGNLLDEDDLDATLDSFFEDFEDDAGQLETITPFFDEDSDSEPESITPALSFIDENVATPALSDSVALSKEESEEEGLVAAGFEDTLDAFFTSEDEQLVIDDGVLATGENETTDDSALIASAVGLGVAALGGASIASESKPEDVVDSTHSEADIDDLIDSFFDIDDDVEKDEQEQEQVVPALEKTVTDVLFEEVSEDTPEDYVIDEQIIEEDISVDTLETDTNDEHVIDEDVATSHISKDSIVEQVVVEASKEDFRQETQQENTNSLTETIDETARELKPEIEANDDQYEDEYLFKNIRGSISSLSFDLSEAVVEGVLRDINALRQKLSGDPIAKSFLQLMSTLSQHILRYQYEASSEAFNLLMSIHKTLEETLNSKVSVRQNILLAETYKVLQWQQDIIESKDVLIAHSREDVAVVDVDEDTVKEDGLFSEGEDELIYAVHEEEVTGKEHDVDMLREELQELRLTLQGEIACLRRDLMQR